YGTTKKWLSLYKANKDKLKGPDKIRPGQTLVIPEAAEFKK
ncbi:MAG: LysM peptidoglycan-binding domain-containing protein, partial [Candidatus Omnitrophica bacterium]|nr:LysM peptidoglycan-binding domain-containing protein [Candidatus Omnitrophota bacterium]